MRRIILLVTVLLLIFCFLFPSFSLRLADGLLRRVSPSPDCMSSPTTSHTPQDTSSESIALPLTITSGRFGTGRDSQASYNSLCMIRSSDGAFLGSYDASDTFFLGKSHAVKNIFYTFKDSDSSNIPHTTVYGYLCDRNIVTQVDAWCRNVDSLSNMQQDILVSEDSIYTPEIALRSRDGLPLWQPPAPLHTMSLTHAHGKTYLAGLQEGSINNNICVFNALTGKGLWCTSTIKSIASTEALITATNGLLLTINQEMLNAHRIEDGALLWTTQLTASANTIYLSRTENIVIGNTLFLSGSGQIQAINLTNGTIIWHVASNDTSGLFFDQGILVIATGDFGENGAPGHTGIFTGRSAADGHILWQQASPYSYWTSADNLVVHGVMYLSGSTSDGDLVYALRIKDGKRLWSDIACDAPFFHRSANEQQQPDGSAQHCYWSKTDTIVQLQPQAT